MAKELKKSSNFKLSVETKFKLGFITKYLCNSSMTNTVERLINEKYNEVAEKVRQTE